MKVKPVKINNWPFGKDEKAKLVWIGEPFQEEKKWMICAYFRSNGQTESVKLNWAAIHFLSVNKTYQNGYLNRAQIPDNIEIIKVNLDNLDVKYNERDWVIQGTGIKTKSKTFNFKKMGKTYTIPMIEVIRAVLAPDRFMLNLILAIDTIDNYLTYDIQDKVLELYFTSEYETKFLTLEKILHIAWVLSNVEIMRMIRDISNSVSTFGGGELKFDFLLKKFNIKARVDEVGNLIKIHEVLAVRAKVINLKQINVYHPSLDKTAEGAQAKKREYIIKASGKDRELYSNTDGATNESELLDTYLIEHEYLQSPEIKRNTTGRSQKRTHSDENTKSYFSEDTGKRTAGDVGGEDLLRGLEFSSLSDIEVEGELEQFIEILKLLERRPSVSRVEIIVNYLPDIKGYRFGRLNDCITRRRYAVGKTVMANGSESGLIDIEREEKSLSLLVLQTNRKVDWKWMYSELLVGLVKESGKWSNDVIEKIRKEGILVTRHRHTKSSINNREKIIYEKLSGEND